MPKIPILQPGQSYTFADYFKLNLSSWRAVSTGVIWQFGNLQRQTKQITQDLNLYRVPADLEELLRILVAILSSPSGNL